MTPYFFRIKSFLAYWLEAVDEHSLHSPFFFDLYTSHIKPIPKPGDFEEIENLRNKLLDDQRTIAIQDFGSKAQKQSNGRISRIARTSLSSKRYSTIYFRLASAFQATTMVELGTSFGINTLYLGKTPGATVTTFEGAPAIADIAGLTFEFAGSTNVQLVVGNIDKTLPDFLQYTRRVDFAFIDANHRYEPTLRYFEWLLKKVHERSVLVVDDIHYSAEMERAWKKIKQHRLVCASADIFRCGILFFDPSLNKQHVILQV